MDVVIIIVVVFVCALFFESWNKSNKNNRRVEVKGINPMTDDEYSFYDFVEKTPAYELDLWMAEAKKQGYQFKPQYEAAIYKKMALLYFKNPLKPPVQKMEILPENIEQYDFIAIDFETANNNRISACAIGLCFVKNNEIVNSIKHYIKPPESEAFFGSHTLIHGITKDDVKNASNFLELWEESLSDLLTNSLIIYHNASMDLSVIKNLIEHYSIKTYSIRHLDTMYLAGKMGIPKKLRELADRYNILFDNLHEPEEDAKVCALILIELKKLMPMWEENVRLLDNNPPEKNNNGGYYANQASEEVLAENETLIEKYSISFDELQELKIENCNFVVTGTFQVDREEIKNFLINRGGILKSGITSKVDYVLAGDECGWSKIQKIHELNISSKANIQILNSTDLDFLRNQAR